MADQLPTLVTQILGTFVGAYLATGLLTLILSIGQDFTYLYQLAIHGLVVAGLTAIVVYYAINQEWVLESIGKLPPSPSETSQDPTPNIPIESDQRQHSVTEYLTEPEKQVLAATEVDDKSPIVEGHETMPANTEYGVEGEAVAVGEQQALMASKHAIQPQQGNEVVTKKKKNNKKSKVRISV